MMTTTRGNAALIALAVALLTCLSVGAAQAQEKAKPKKVQDRVADLETQVQRMDKTLADIVGADDPAKIREQQTELQEKVGELATQIAEMKEGAANMTTADEERGSRLDAAAQEIENLWKEIENLKAKLEEATKNEIAGYDNGFFVQSRDGKNKLVIGGFAKPYYQATINKVYDLNAYGAVQGTTNTSGQLVPLGGDNEVTSSGFGLAATRLYFKAQVFGMVNFMGELDYGTLNGKVSYPYNAQIEDDTKYNRVTVNQYSLRVLAFYGEFAPIPELKIRAGQFKVPFDRETLVGSHQLTFTSPTLMTRRYSRWGESDDPANCTALACAWDYESARGSSFGYDRGFMVHGEIAGAMFNYAVGMFNGSGPNVGNDNRDVLVGGRLWTDPLGAMSAGMSDIDATEKPLLSVGASYFFDLPQHRDPSIVSSKDAIYNSEDSNITGDVLFKWMGASVMGSIFFRNSDHGAVLHTTNTAGREEKWVLRSLGASAQAAFFIKAIGLEPAFRYGMYDADLKREMDHVHEFTAALNYYVFGNNLKLQLEYRGQLPADQGRSYLVPWMAYQPNVHEITVMGQVAF
jgi:hypothetical protein